jgi:E3 ubiquitin-protein ligase NEDD4
VVDEAFKKMETRFGEMVAINLKPGGADIAVTEENKKEYVDLTVEYHISKRVKDQSDAFMSGFNELIPQDLIKVFDEFDLDRLIGGMSQINVYVFIPFPSLHILIRLLRFHRRDDWAKFTVYCGYKSNDKVIRWFWGCVRSWPVVRRSSLLRFATGTSRLPIDGFRDLQGPDGPMRFTIAKAGDPKQLPKSHMSFNRIDLPPYKNYASLEQNLSLAVERVSL